MAVPAREAHRAHDRQQGRHRRIVRHRVPQGDTLQAGLRRPLGDPPPVLTLRRPEGIVYAVRQHAAGDERGTRVKFGIFYEHQIPRPWSERSEYDVFQNSLAQIELADRLGYDYAWVVEHHFLEEYSHSSAPEVFLGAASQRTKRIRLGHGIVQLPPAFNHPARVVERAATLDLISGGRVDLGTGEASSQAELGGFGVVRDQKREQWEEALDAVARMFVEEPFAGVEGRHLQMPPRNVMPKSK